MNRSSSIFLATVGALLGLVLAVLSPWSQLIIDGAAGILAESSVANHPGLSSLVRVGAFIFAYPFWPVVLAWGGYSRGSR